MIENSEKAVSLTTEERCLPVTHTLGCVVRPCSECVVVAGVDIADCSWWCGRVCIAARCEGGGVCGAMEVPRCGGGMAARL